MLDLIYTGNKVLSPVFTVLSIQYIKSWDAFLAYGRTAIDSGYSLYKLFRDGTLLNFGYGPKKGTPGNMPYGLHFWKATSANWPGLFRRGDEVTGLFIYQNTMVTGLPDDSKHTQFESAHFLDYSKDRYVMISSNHVLRVYTFSSGELLYSLPVSNFLTTAYQSCFIMWVGENKVVVLSGNSGKFIVLDYMNLTYDPINTVLPCRAAAYDSLNGLITTVGTDRKIRLFPLVAIPTGLAVPVFDPFASEITTQRGYKVKTRLLDASGNPCVNWVVRWDAPNLGFLERQTSKTDAAGYAWNFYFAPINSLGMETLTVRTFVP